ncbi:MAG: TPM domain-containing protein [Hormoscilla sp. GUM202]|nr:TPM domain-containing protein [Hormoscilla sp. GUM202]
MRKLLSQLDRLILPLVALLLATQLLALPAGATGVYQMPNLTAGDDTWVVDMGEAISRLNEGKLSSQLSKLAQETGNEVRMVTIRRLDYGETIDSFAELLLAKWFPTPEAQANQTLVVLDIVTNNIGIRTGAAVKQLMSDDIAQSVVSETMQVPIRNDNQYNRAFLAAGDRLTAVLSGKPDPGPPAIEDNVQVEGTFATAEETKNSNATTWVIVLLILATIIPMVTYFWLYQN